MSATVGLPDDQDDTLRIKASSLVCTVLGSSGQILGTVLMLSSPGW